MDAACLPCLPACVAAVRWWLEYPRPPTMPHCVPTTALIARALRTLPVLLSAERQAHLHLSEAMPAKKNNDTSSPSPKKLIKTKLKAKWSAVSKASIKTWAIEHNVEFELNGEKVDKDNCSNTKIVDIWVNHLWTEKIDYKLEKGEKGRTLGEKIDYNE